MSRRNWLASVALIGAFAVLYWHVIAKLVGDWVHDDNYSHGFAVLPIALYLVAQRRRQLAEAPVRPAFSGLLVVAASLATMAAGVLGSELFLTRVSMLGAIAGTALFAFGWPVLRLLAFPVAFLLLMIPIPTIVFNQIAFPLQLLASRAGEFLLSLCGVPVLREGNLIVLASVTLEVAEACSGIRSLITLLTIAIVLGYWGDRRSWVRIAIAFTALPVAILANAARVAGTGLAAEFYSVRVAQGFFHSFSGWVIFIVASIMLLGCRRLILAVVPLDRRPARGD